MPREIPVSGLPLLTYKLRTGGLAWLRERLLREWEMPTTAPGRGLYRLARAVRHPWGRRAALPRGGGAPEALYAFYDLAVGPITFDFLWFLVVAELARRRAGLTSVHIVIVPGRHDGLRKEDPEYEGIVDLEARRARIGNVLVPACALLPSVSGVTVASSRSQADGLREMAAGHVFPDRYEPAMPTYPGPRDALRAAREEGAEIGVLRAGEQDLRAVERWLAMHGRRGRLVTITLRSYAYMPARNSDLSAWAAFARRLDRTNVSVVFVPDTDQCFDGSPAQLDGFPVFFEAALNLGLRMALYERAYLNLGVNNGPMGLCWLNDRTRYLTFKMLTDAVPQTTPEYMKFLGFEIGASLPFAKPWQKWVWEDDRLDVIEREFAQMEAILKSAGPG